MASLAIERHLIMQYVQWMSSCAQKLTSSIDSIKFLVRLFPQYQMHHWLQSLTSTYSNNTWRKHFIDICDYSNRMWYSRSSWKSFDVDARGCWVDASENEASHSSVDWLNLTHVCVQLNPQFIFVLFIFRSTRMMIPFTSSSSLFWKFYTLYATNAMEQLNRARNERTFYNIFTTPIEYKTNKWVLNPFAAQRLHGSVFVITTLCSCVRVLCAQRHQKYILFVTCDSMCVKKAMPTLTASECIQ